MKTNQQISDEMHEIARAFPQTQPPYIAILQARRDMRETPAQAFATNNERMLGISSTSVSFHAIDGNPVDIAYNYLFEKALEDNAKYALCIEEDTVVPWDGAAKLLLTAEANPGCIVVGVYYVKFSGVMVGTVDDQNRTTLIDATPNTGLRRNITTCGLGCALVPLDVVRKIKEKFVDIPLFCCVPEGCWNDTDVRAMGQDTWFYNLVKQVGVEVICDTAVQCLHMELATGKYTAHPDVDLSTFVTSIPITEPLALRDRERVSKDYFDRIQKPTWAPPEEVKE